MGAIFALIAAAAASGAGQADALAVRLIDSQPQGVLVRDMVGDYRQHGPAARALIGFAAVNCRGQGVVFGEYPDDPDVVGVANARWRIGFELPAGRACASEAAPAPFRRARIEGGRMAMVETRLSEVRQMGLRLYAWLPAHDYVQIGPTRMEFLDASGDPGGRVRILVPVRARTWASARQQ